MCRDATNWWRPSGTGWKEGTPRNARKAVGIGRPLVPAARLIAMAAPLSAQTDFYNTSVGRPLRIEYPSPVEYRGVELDLAPLRWEIGRNATHRWFLHPNVQRVAPPDMMIKWRA